MRSKIVILTTVLVGFALMAAYSFVPKEAAKNETSVTIQAEVPEKTKLRVQEAYGKLPLHFELNQGQTDPKVQFLSRGSGYTLFLTPTEAVLALSTPREKTKAASHDTGLTPEDPEKVTTNVLRMQLVGANQSPQVAGLEQLPGKSHYLIGNDHSKWRTNVPHYARVKYEAVYPGIDLVYYGNQRRLEHDFVVAPGADPKAIRLSFKGAEKLSLDDVGNLVLHTSGGEVLLRTPLIYQEVESEKQVIPGLYALHGKDLVGFHVAAYDTSRPLIIDPVLEYSTYLGGSHINSP